MTQKEIFDKAKLTNEDKLKILELIKKHTTNNGQVELYFVFKEYYEWLAKNNKNDIH